MSIIKKVKNTITENELIKRGDSVLCAVSGGSDSVAMISILSVLSKEMGFSLYAAHVNHNIREEAKRDEDFVVGLCEGMGIKCFVKSVDIPKLSKDESMSEELLGRKVRYEFFDELCEKFSITKIATAHNKNDSAESVLLHLIRGCGIDGLCGIPVKRGNIIRPIIDITKREVENYLKENSIEFVTDKTNFKTDYTRNKIRLEILPVILEEINSGFIDTVTKNTKIFSEISEFLEDHTEKAFENICNGNKLDISLLKNEKDAVIKLLIQKLYLKYSNGHEKLSIKYINEAVKLLKNGVTSKTLNLPNKCSLRIEYGKLFFEKTSNEKIMFDYDIKEGESVVIKEINAILSVKKEEVLGKNTKDKVYFYLESETGLHVRNRRNGDHMMPVGMTGRKNISDIFSDMKIASDKRDLIPILMQGDNVIWVAGTRRDRRFTEGKILMSCKIVRGEQN